MAAPLAQGGRVELSFRTASIADGEIDMGPFFRMARAVAFMAAAAVIALAPAPTRADPPPPSDTGTAADPNRIVPTTGWWWASTEGGRGYSIEVKLDTGNAFIAAYVYDASGKAGWYIANLRAQTSEVISQGFYGPFNISTSFTGTLQQASGGQVLGGAYKAPKLTDIGAITLKFTSATSGVITWPSAITQRSTLISRYPINGVAAGVTNPTSGLVPQAGWWFATAEGGRGYFIEVQGRTAFVAAYMYRADGTPVWYAGGNAITTTSAMQVTLSEYANGPTFANPTNSSAITSAQATVASLQFASATTGTISFDGGTPIPIVRFTAF